MSLTKMLRLEGCWIRFEGLVGRFLYYGERCVFFTMSLFLAPLPCRDCFTAARAAMFNAVTVIVAGGIVPVL